MAGDARTRLHASAVLFHGKGVLIRGTSGSGKSSLGLQLIALGADLVADDQVDVWCVHGGVFAAPPPAIAGLIEARGIGLLRRNHVPECAVHLVIDLDQVETQRLPPARTFEVLGVPIRCLHKMMTPAWPAEIAVYLTSDRLDPDDHHVD